MTATAPAPRSAGFPYRAHLAVLLAGLLFGSTFVPMQDAIERAEPVPFVAVRFLVGAIVLLPLAAGRRSPGPGEGRAGVVCGAVLALGYVLQTVGLQYTTTSASAFITYLLVIFVPVLAFVVLRRTPTRLTLVGVVLATAGLFLLTGRGVGFGRGELLTIGCAVAFAVHILLLDHFANRFDVFRLSAVQLATVAGLLALPGLAMGGYDFGAAAWQAAVYTGVVVSAGALVLQLWGQRQVGPTRTSLLLTVEPVTAAVLGYVIGERLGPVGLLGAALILAGIVVSEAGALLTARSRTDHAPGGRADRHATARE